MLTHPTIDQLHQLGLTGMARAFTELEANPQSAELSRAEWLGLLLDRESSGILIAALGALEARFGMARDCDHRIALIDKTGSIW